VYEVNFLKGGIWVLRRARLNSAKDEAIGAVVDMVLQKFRYAESREELKLAYQNFGNC
jgi:hypothetical protein